MCSDYKDRQVTLRKDEDEEEDRILCKNKVEIRLLTNHARIKIKDLEVTTKIHTLKISRKFKRENSELFRKVYTGLLCMMFDIFDQKITEEVTGNLPDHILNSEGSHIKKFFLKSDELKKEFLRNIVRALDWIFGNSKLLNEAERSLAVIKGVERCLRGSNKEIVENCMRNYVINWISFHFVEEEKISELEIQHGELQNKFVRFLTSVFVNTPLIQTDKLHGKSIPIRQYLQYGSIYRAAVNFTRTKKRDRSANVDVQLGFLQNFCKNIKIVKKKKNLQKIRNLFSSIDTNSFGTFKKENLNKVRNLLVGIETNSLVWFYQNFDKRKTGDSTFLEKKRIQRKRVNDLDMNSCLSSDKYEKMNSKVKSNAEAVMMYERKEGSDEDLDMCRRYIFCISK